MSDSDGAVWAELAIPPRLDMLSAATQLASGLAGRCGFDAAGRGRIELALEEVLGTVLRYSYGEGKGDEGRIEVRFEVAPPFFNVGVLDRGLPFDLSLVPTYDPTDAEASDERESGLWLHLVKHSVERCQVVNAGRDGVRFELSWFLPGEPVEEAGGPQEADPAAPEPVEGIRALDDAFALQIARLVYRGYGYSYVYGDVYYPDRIRAHFQSGMLMSWGAVTASGQLVGHLALAKESAESGALEWGVAVVDPRWRGMGLMERMLQAAMAHAAGRDEKVLCAHAVTAHPYTQKTCLKFGFQPIALLLGYAPATLKFRGIGEGLKQRESTFLAARCTHPLPPMPLHLPRRHAPALLRLLDALGAAPDDALRREADEDADLQGIRTEYASLSAQCINVGKIHLSKTGADVAEVLRRERRRLCRERVDVIYLTLDLADPGVGIAVRAAEQNGFFLAGLAPMMNWPYGATFQFLNNIDVNFDALCVQGELAQWLRDLVKSEKERVEA
jgi:anti-sigma regulatory factor (Ser/Thr protein kinase)/predicted GNAT family N-acyltransferase